MLDLKGNKVKYVVNVILMSFILSCTSVGKIEVDTIVTAKRIYLCNSGFELAEAMAIKDGKIVATGTKDEILDAYQSNDLQESDAYIYPGFIDAHSHFYGYARTLLRVDLKHTASLDEVVQRAYDYAQTTNDHWIQGRGWDNTSWTEQGFPNNIKLNLLFPDRPVLLRRVDGHAALANQAALDLAGITIDTKVDGGEVEVRNGLLTGILIDNAVDLVLDLIDEPVRSNQIKALIEAERNCFEVGLTTVTDAGQYRSQILLIDSLQNIGALKIKTYIMSNPHDSDIAYWINRGPYRTDAMEMRSFKLYADGSLGSRGAKLKEDYCDKEGHNGFWLTPLSRLDSVCNQLYEAGFQVATHCIGDSANKKMLEIYGSILGGENTKRWRIEHAQVVSPEDRALYKKYSIIPSVQPTHATSDMNWAEKRLCKHRMDGAYAYKSLLAIHGYIPFGTDFPIENISPLHTFYSAVHRKDINEQPRDGFIMDEALNPKDALMAMTLWAAQACFMDDRIGSLETGKFADFVILDQDMLYHNHPYRMKVRSTWSNGFKVYSGH